MSNTERIKPQVVYVPTPISEKPTVTGWYSLTNLNQEFARYKQYFTHSYFFDEGEWLALPRMPITHWLKPLSLFTFTEDELVELKREIAEKAWGASRDRCYAEEFGQIPNPFPDRETFIESIIK